MDKYVVSENLPPEMKRAGMAYEIVDRKHWSDHGPMAVAWLQNQNDAANLARVLNANGKSDLMREALEAVTNYFWGTESPILSEGDIQALVESALR